MLGGGKVTQADMKKFEELLSQCPVPPSAIFHSIAFPTCVAPEEPDTAPINYLALNREFS